MILHRVDRQVVLVVAVVQAANNRGNGCAALGVINRSATSCDIVSTPLAGASFRGLRCYARYHVTRGMYHRPGDLQAAVLIRLSRYAERAYLYLFTVQRRVINSWAENSRRWRTLGYRDDAFLSVSGARDNADGR